MWFTSLLPRTVRHNFTITLIFQSASLQRNSLTIFYMHNLSVTYIFPSKNCSVNDTRPRTPTLEKATSTLHHTFLIYSNILTTGLRSFTLQKLRKLQSLTKSQVTSQHKIILNITRNTLSLLQFLFERNLQINYYLTVHI